MDGQNLDVYAVLDLAPPRPGPGAALTEAQFGQMIKGFHKVATEVGYFPKFQTKFDLIFFCFRLE